jgi:translocation and assembly module TamB
MVRQRLIARLEEATGGRVELGDFRVFPSTLEVGVQDLTIHGKEDSHEVPYAHVDRLSARIKILSVLSRDIGLDSVLLRHPVVHVIFYPDGSTNQPEPRLKVTSDKTPVESLFDLSVSRLTVERGALLWDNQRIPLEFVADDVDASLSYAFLRKRYESRVSIGKVDTRFQDYRPFAWRMETVFALTRDSVDIHSLRWASGRSSLEASGRVVDFRSPNVTAEYALTVDLAEAAAVSRLREVRGGAVEFKGKGTWSKAEFTADGKVGLRGIDWQDKNLLLSQAAAEGVYSINNHVLRVNRLDAKLFGGVVSGDLEWNGWMNGTESVSAQQSKAPAAKGSTRGWPECGGRAFR